ncbi:MAG TPA: ATP-binding cassette domain-containing protein [Myxococcales bacterium]|nr:ATP-binding cassette domain-containing protein [Myxococcales bacterium]
MIQVTELHKHYSVHRRPPGLWAAFRSVVRRPTEIVKAVDGISFSIEAGERVGFLGPNGAGKTTTLKVLSGLLFPTSGSALVAGHVPFRRETAFLRQITLVMGQKQQLLWDLPPSETFELNRALYEIPKTQFHETLAELTELLDLERVSKVPTRQLSLGERMKCELCAALLHRPKVLFLDEPTIGLDVSMQSALRGFVRAYNERFGATVLLTSHYMDDVLALCPRVIVIDKGRLRYDGKLADLTHTLRPEKRVAVRLSRAIEAADLDRFGKLTERGPDRVVFQVPQDALRDRVARVIAELPVADMTIEDPPLEEIMRDLFAAPASP